MPQNTSRGYTYPLYGDANNFPAQIQDMATDIDGDMQTLYNRIAAAKNQPACDVWGSAVQAVAAASTGTAAIYDLEQYDNDNMVNLGVSNTTVTFTETGIYIVTGRVSFSANGNGNGRQISFTTSGVLGNAARKTVQGETGRGVALNLTAILFATAGDTMVMAMRQNSGLSADTTTRRLQVAKVSVL